jgi:hypothetical protein
MSQKERARSTVIKEVEEGALLKTKFILFRSNCAFYIEDTSPGKQTSLRARDETKAESLPNARNEAHRQHVLNLHLARAYLTPSYPAFVKHLADHHGAVAITRQGEQPRALRQRVQVVIL